LIAADSVAGTTVFSVSGSGVVTASAYQYSSPKTYHVSIPGEGFIVWNSALGVNLGGGNGGASFNGASSRLNAPVYLPDGATVTALSMMIYDDNANAYNIECDFESISIPGPGYMDYASVVSSGQTTSYRQFSSATNFVISNTANAYFISCFSNPYGQTWSSMLVSSVTVTYTMTSPS